MERQTKFELVIKDNEKERTIYSKWTEHEYIFTYDEISTQKILCFQKDNRYEEVRADGMLVVREILF